MSTFPMNETWPFGAKGTEYNTHGSLYWLYLSANVPNTNGSQLVCVCLCVCNFDFSNGTKNQALVSTLQAQCDKYLT